MKLLSIFFILLFPIISLSQLSTKSLIDTLGSMSKNQIINYKNKLTSSKQITKEVSLLIDSQIADLNNNYIKSFEILVELSYEKNDYSDFTKMYANLLISRKLIEYQLFDEAIKKNKLCVFYGKKNKVNVNEILKERSNVYFRKQNYSEAYKYYLIGLENSDSIGRASNYNNLALCQIRLKNYSLALDLYNKGLQFVSFHNENPFKEVEYLIKGNIGSLYLQLNDLEKAKIYLTEEYDYYKKIKSFSFDYISCLIDLIKIDLLENRSIELKWKDLMFYSNQLKGNENPINALNKIKSVLLPNLNDSQKNQLYNIGFQFQSNYIQNVVERQKEITKLLYSGNLKSLEKANALENQKLDLLTRNNQYKTVILFVLGVLLVLFIFLNNKIRKYNKVQLSQNELIQSQKNQLFESSQKVLELEISQQQEQLQSLSMNLKIKKETEENFLNKIKVLKRNKNLNPDAIINELQISVKNLIEVDRKLDFTNKEYLHHNKILFENLKVYHPNLSNQEIEFCHYCIFELSSKEIGQITGQTDGAVRVYKNNIKNKLGLTKENDLLEYLKKLNARK